MPIRKEMLKRYPKDWAVRSRFVRFHRARNRCEWCGVHNYTIREDTGAVVVLTAAHVYDKRPEACSLLNLAALASGATSATTLRTASKADGKGPAARSWRWRSEMPLGEQLAGLDTEYEVEVRSKSSSGESAPALVKVRTHPKGGMAV